MKLNQPDTSGGPDMSDKPSFGARIRSILWFFIKLILAAGIIVYIVYGARDKISLCFHAFNLTWLIPAMILYGAHILVTAWRWQKLALILDIPISYGESLSLSMQALFFSLVIPGGAIGGDVIKMGVISKRTKPGSRAEGAFTVLMDRIIGMIALFVLSLILLPGSVALFENLPLPDTPGMNLNEIPKITILWAVAALCVCGLLASCALFFHRIFMKIPLFVKVVSYFDRHTHELPTRLMHATDIYSNNWKKVCNLTIVSILFVHLMTVWPLWCLLAGLGVSVSPIAVITAVTIGNIVGLLPIFPSGIGGRDIVVIAFLVASGVPVDIANTAQLLYTGILLLFTLSGGFFFIFDPGRKTANPS